MLLVYPEFISKRAEILSNLLKIKSIPIKIRYFPNGEVLARLLATDAIKNQNILIYFPTYPNTNCRLNLLFQTLEVLNEYGANEISLIIPYFPYSRQDKRFLEGECISLKLILNIFNSLNVTSLITINPHNADALINYSKNIKVVTLDLFSDLLNKVLYQLKNRDTVLIAPDHGRCADVKNLSNIFDIDYICLKKERDKYTGKVTIQLEDDISIVHKTLLMIDDEISTGGTLSKASKLLHNKGSTDVYACAIHLLLIGDAVDKMSSSGIKGIFGTNTVNNPYSILDIEPYLADGITSSK